MDTGDEAEAFYQDQYTPEYPQVRLPEPEELQKLTAKNFAGTALDLGAKIRILKALRQSGRVLDYGCSWGYGTYQLAQHGFAACGFEISRLRAHYARENLGVQVFQGAAELRALPPGSLDIIFTNHVLEHLPTIRETLELMSRLLSDEGLAFHILPNFTGRTARSGMWLSWIGEEHPIAPTIEFFAETLPRHGFGRILFASSPFDEALERALRGESGTLQTEGDELLVVAMRP
jgi:2-polyprenyl-3-methyl-5-hydroxy-6-metoxy-1,4-benzoquinol methylase